MILLDISNIEQTMKYVSGTQFYGQVIAHTQHGAARDGAISVT